MVCRRLSWIVMGLVVAVAGCKGAETPESPYATPEGTFAQVKKALLNRDADLMWECLAPSWQAVFDQGRKDLLAKPADQLEQIAREGMATPADLQKLDAKGFFRFYFNMKKRETFETSSPEILEKKADLVRDAQPGTVEYNGAKANATKGVLKYTLEGQEFRIPMVKVENRWLMDVAKSGGASPVAP